MMDAMTVARNKCAQLNNVLLCGRCDIAALSCTKNGTLAISLLPVLSSHQRVRTNQAKMLRSQSIGT
jgi:hypothetical protein